MAVIVVNKRKDCIIINLEIEEKYILVIEFC